MSASAPTTKKSRLHPGLLLALVGAGLLSAWALMSDDTDTAAAQRHVSAPGRSAAAAYRSQDDVAGPRSNGGALPTYGSSDKTVERDPQAMRVALQEQLQRLSERSEFGELSAQGRKAWASALPPPPPPPKPLPPPPPQAPPFPYQFVGRWQDDAPSPGASAAASTSAIVAGPLTTWVVKTGDVIEGQWRVEAIEGSQLRVLYLPLSQSQTVDMHRS